MVIESQSPNDQKHGPKISSSSPAHEKEKKKPRANENGYGLKHKRRSEIKERILEPIVWESKEDRSSET